MFTSLMPVVDGNLSDRPFGGDDQLPWKPSFPCSLRRKLKTTDVEVLLPHRPQDRQCLRTAQQHHARLEAERVPGGVPEPNGQLGPVRGKRQAPYSERPLTQGSRRTSTMLVVSGECPDDQFSDCFRADWTDLFIEGSRTEAALEYLRGPPDLDRTPSAPMYRQLGSYVEHHEATPACKCFTVGAADQGTNGVRNVECQTVHPFRGHGVTMVAQFQFPGDEVSPLGGCKDDEDVVVRLVVGGDAEKAVDGAVTVEHLDLLIRPNLCSTRLLLSFILSKIT